MGLPLIFNSIINLIVFLMFRETMPWARRRWFTVAFWSAALLAVVPWALLAALGWRALDDGLGPLTGAAWMVSIVWQVAIVAAAMAWPVWRTLVAFIRRHDRAAQRVNPQRRALLGRLGALVPTGALMVSAVGVAAASFTPFVRRLTLYFSDLHPDLDGFRIGQFSDVHAGPFVSAAHVNAAIAALNAERVDLTVMTGDLLDDTSMMPALNRAFSTCTARHGLIGVLGNHEYYAGLETYLSHARKGPMRLLIDESIRLHHGAARIHVAGVDYPFRGMDGPAAAAAASMSLAMAGAQPGDFKLCLAHHPTCWEEARKHGAHLTLSGHTHGGQVALGGTSLFAKMFKYILGLYEVGPHRLYVTAGLGHWFPFRLGCPAEVVVVELRQGHEKPA
jgi:predicted MPP superfamily phosphohydrolase